MKYFFYLFSAILLIYMVLPGPKNVDQFGALPNSLKSTEPGDTTQIANVAAYFSNDFRSFVIPFYKHSFLDNFNYFGIKMPFIGLNHPPEYAALVVRPYIQSWYLEEFVHPLRESLYVNGWEPFDENGARRNKYSFGITINDIPFKSKTTIRYYTSPLWVRILVWAGITFSLVLLYKISKKAFKETYA